MGDRTPPERYTVPEAADLLGTTSEGVRSRIKRGTLEAVREGGRVFVVLEAAPPRPDAAPTHDRTGDRAELVDELHARVSSLERQLDLERDANRENRRIIAGLVERVPALEPPAEPVPPSQTRESPESASEPRPSTTGSSEAERPAEPRPWWRRVFGG